MRRNELKVGSVYVGGHRPTPRTGRRRIERILGNPKGDPLAQITYVALRSDGTVSDPLTCTAATFAAWAWREDVRKDGGTLHVVQQFSPEANEAELLRVLADPFNGRALTVEAGQFVLCEWLAAPLRIEKIATGRTLQELLRDYAQRNA